MIHVVDSHHKVLVHWANYRNGLIKPPRLITLDHHTDTSKPFRRYFQAYSEKNQLMSTVRQINNNSNLGENSELNQEFSFAKIQKELLQNIDYKNPVSIHQAVELLNNDEHIVAAIKSDIISSAHVLAHNAANTNLETYLEHKIMCRTVNELLDVDGRFQPDCDTVLESQLLDSAIIEFNKILKQNCESDLFSEAYILDIDLDYFNTFQSVEPKDSQSFKSLVLGAGLITIATEPDYVKSCALNPGLTSEYLLRKLESLIHS